ncbi:cellulose synthase (UDP-forming) [Sarracenia purpurea var. burkii]
MTIDQLIQLEEIRGSSRSPRSSFASTTPSSGTQTSGDGLRSSAADFSPKSFEKHCRPIEDVLVETEVKGSLMERLILVENRVLKLCLHLEEELEAGEKMRRGEKALEGNKTPHNNTKKKGFKYLVKTFVKGRNNKESA